MSDSFENARELIYKNVEQIEFEGMVYRKDIGTGLWCNQGFWKILEINDNDFSEDNYKWLM